MVLLQVDNSCHFEAEEIEKKFLSFKYFPAHLCAATHFNFN